MLTEVFVQANVQKKINGVNSKCWVLDFAALSRVCDVSALVTDTIVPLR